MPTDVEFEDITESLKRCAGWLRDAGIEHVLAGSLAAWARGGPATCSDVDFLIRPGDAEPALQALESYGLRTERPPEGWLLKAYDGDVLIDLIHDPNGPGFDEVMASADTLTVLSIELPVMSVTDLIVTKLRSFEEHYVDIEGVLPIARALREQIDWAAVRRRTHDNPYAAGFFAIAERLDLVEAPRIAPAPIKVSTA